MFDELEEFNRFRLEYEKDPVFAAYQNHKMVECLLKFMKDMNEFLEQNDYHAK